MFRLKRTRIAYLHDVIMAGVSFVLSQYLRLGDTIGWYASEYLWLGTALFVAVAAGVFATTDLYRGIWRYASLDDMLAIVKAATLTVLVFFPLLFLLTRLDDVPRSSLIINWFVLMALLGGPRVVYRVFKDRSLEAVMARSGRRRIPVLLVGAGDATELFLRSIVRQPEANYEAVGIIDDKEKRVGRRMHGVAVMGGLDDIPKIVGSLAGRGKKPQRLIISRRDRLDGQKVSALLETASALGLTLARLPDLTEFKSGLNERIEPRPVALEDLLGRAQTVLDRASMRRLIEGRRVLITGAGGSIGGELVRQISDFAPSHVSLLDSSEHALYAVDLELSERHTDLSRRALLADVRDRRAVDAAFAQERPDLVFHAAALKHVPVVENQPVEGVLTNVLGTVNVAEAARQTKVSAMVLVSTDKAVNPSSVMGATKRLAESYCQSLDLAAGADGTRFVTVRFGNVLGSTGSVVPLFQRQLAAGGPLTVTHPDVSRYFMTIGEAVELVLQASALGARGSGGSGKIFVLEMGEPVRIQDLARQVIRLAGLAPDVDVMIEFTGLRPGEKIHEELLHASEDLVPTECAGLLLAAPRTANHNLLARGIDELADTARSGARDQAMAILHRLVPEYRDGRDQALRTAAS
ncbi:MAG: nucleoside-diphosphate sugar epimerase/dehydratase [Alphaproteobacteria bacterium]|nr:nucleoside-diphosphate sugar epimerase/dehydratase [Alphaproteobacteria bacterium]